MALSEQSKVNIAFKKLEGKAQTDNLKKASNENEGTFLNLPASKIFVDTINADPSIAVSEGIAMLITADLVLIDGSNDHAFEAIYKENYPELEISIGDRVKNAISPSFGYLYEAKIYESGTNLRISVDDQRDWVYQYEPGIFFQQTVGTTPGTVILYVYTGETFSSSGNDKANITGDNIEIESFNENLRNYISINRNIYVNTSGDDINGTGEIGFPFETFERALKEIAYTTIEKTTAVTISLGLSSFEINENCVNYLNSLRCIGDGKLIIKGVDPVLILNSISTTPDVLIPFKKFVTSSGFDITPDFYRNYFGSNDGIVFYPIASSGDKFVYSQINISFNSIYKLGTILTSDLFNPFYESFYGLKLGSLIFENIEFDFLEDIEVKTSLKQSLYFKTCVFNKNLTLYGNTSLYVENSSLQKVEIKNELGVNRYLYGSGNENNIIVRSSCLLSFTSEPFSKFELNTFTSTIFYIPQLYTSNYFIDSDCVLKEDCLFKSEENIIAIFLGNRIVGKNIYTELDGSTEFMRAKNISLGSYNKGYSFYCDNIYNFQNQTNEQITELYTNYSLNNFLLAGSENKRYFTDRILGYNYTAQLSGRNEPIVFSKQNGKIYTYTYSIIPVDNEDVLNTTDGGSTRYISIDYKISNLSKKVTSTPTSTQQLSLLGMNSSGDLKESTVYIVKDFTEFKNALLSSSDAITIVLQDNISLTGNIPVSSINVSILDGGFKLLLSGNTTFTTTRNLVLHFKGILTLYGNYTILHSNFNNYINLYIGSIQGNYTLSLNTTSIFAQPFRFSRQYDESQTITLLNVNIQTVKEDWMFISGNNIDLSIYSEKVTSTPTSTQQLSLLEMNEDGDLKESNVYTVKDFIEFKNALLSSADEITIILKNSINLIGDIIVNCGTISILESFINSLNITGDVNFICNRNTTFFNKGTLNLVNEFTISNTNINGAYTIFYLGNLNSIQNLTLNCLGEGYLNLICQFNAQNTTVITQGVSSFSQNDWIYPFNTSFDKSHLECTVGTGGDFLNFNQLVLFTASNLNIKTVNVSMISDVDSPLTNIQNLTSFTLNNYGVYNVSTEGGDLSLYFKNIPSLNLSIYGITTPKLNLTITNSSLFNIGNEPDELFVKSLVLNSSTANIILTTDSLELSDSIASITSSKIGDVTCTNSELKLTNNSSTFDLTSFSYLKTNKITINSGVNTDSFPEILKKTQHIVDGNNQVIIISEEYNYITNHKYKQRPGIDWELIDTELDNKLWRSVVYGNGKFVAVGNASGQTSGKVMTSTDGINWLLVDGLDFNAHEVVYGNGKFVAIGTGAILGELCISSVDGLVWELVTLSIQTEVVNQIVFHNGFFVISASGNFTGIGTYAVIFSKDLVIWNNVGSPSLGTQVINNLSFGNGFIYLFYDTNKIAYTNTVTTHHDDLYFQPLTKPTDVLFNTTNKPGCYGNGVYIVKNAYSTTNGVEQGYIYSYDGINWLFKADGEVSQDIVYGDGIFASGISYISGLAYILYSYDGLSWKKVLVESGYWKNITYGNGVFICVDTYGKVYKSGDIVEFKQTLEGSSDVRAAGDDGEIQFVNSERKLDSSPDLHYDVTEKVLNLKDRLKIGDQLLHADATIDIKSQGNTFITTHTRLSNSTDNVLFQLYDNGIFKIKEADDVPSHESGFTYFRTTTNNEVIVTFSDGVIRTISIDKLKDLLDVVLTNIQDGDILVYSETLEKFKNNQTKEFDYIIHEAQLNIVDNITELTFTIPASYKIENIYINEKSNSSAGNMVIGSTLHGTDIVNTVSISNAYDNILTIAKPYFSTTNNTPIFVEFTNIGTAVVDIYFTFLKIK